MLCQLSESRKFETSKTRVEGGKSKIADFVYSRLALGFPKWYSTLIRITLVFMKLLAIHIRKVPDYIHRTRLYVCLIK